VAFRLADASTLVDEGIEGRDLSGTKILRTMIPSDVVSDEEAQAFVEAILTQTNEVLSAPSDAEALAGWLCGRVLAAGAIFYALGHATGRRLDLDGMRDALDAGEVSP